MRRAGRGAVIKVLAMNARGWIIPAAAALAALTAASSTAQPSAAVRARHRVTPPEPVVVELFTA